MAKKKSEISKYLAKRAQGIRPQGGAGALGETQGQALIVAKLWPFGAYHRVF